MDSNLRREIIMDNYQDPMNRGLIEDDSYLKDYERLYNKYTGVLKSLGQDLNIAPIGSRAN